MRTDNAALHKGAGSIAAKLSATWTASVLLCSASKRKSCYVLGQNIGLFLLCDESALAHQSFMRLWFLPDVKVFRCSSLRLPGSTSLTRGHDGDRTELEMKRGHPRAVGQNQYDWTGRNGGDGEQ